jgi:hypothetical protein
VKRSHRFAALIAVFAACTAASSPPSALSAAQRHDLLLRYAACVAAREPETVRTFLFERGSAQDRGEFDRLGSKECVVEAGVRDFRTFRAQAAALAGAWGELALKAVPASLEASFAGLPPLLHVREQSMAEFDPKGRLSREQFAARVANSNRDRQIMLLGECVVRAAPAQSRAFVETPFGSAEERAAVMPLGPALQHCVGAGSVKLLPQQLRGALAYNYMRLAVAADPSLKTKLF